MAERSLSARPSSSDDALGPPSALFSPRHRAVLVVQCAAILVLVALSTGSQALVRAGEFRPRLFDIATFLFVDAENSLPAYYSSAALLAAAAILAAIASRARRLGLRGHPLRWGGLAVVFAILSVDELLALHERAVEPLRDTFGIESGPLYFAWIIPGVALCVILATLYMPFLLTLPKRIRTGIVASGALFVAGAVGVEALSAIYVSSTAPDRAYASMKYVAITTVEETFEMVAIAVFISVLVRYFDNQEVEAGAEQLHPERGPLSVSMERSIERSAKPDVWVESDRVDPTYSTRLTMKG